MKATLSILGLWMQDPTLFNSLHLPTGVDLDTVRDTILYDLADLEVLYPSAPFMKTMIDLWSTKELPTWTRLYTAMQLEYNPLENYDRQEDWTDTRDDTRTLLDTLDAESHDTGTRQTDNYVAGYNDPSLVENAKSVETPNLTSTVDNTRNSTDSLDGELVHSGRVHGNIGVTTSQQMLESELKLVPQLNIINYIVHSFKMRFCLLVY